MKIQFDYRFDTNGFFTAERRSALNRAGEIWSNLLQDDFAEIPVDSEFTLQNPQTGAIETIVLEREIDDLVIFVGAAAEPFDGIVRGNSASVVGHKSHLSGCCCKTCSSHKAENLGSLAQAQYDGIDIQGDIFQRRISNNFRGEGAVTDFEPWVGTISFANDPTQGWDFSLNNPDSSKFDFVSVALHEIGHVLGIGTAPIFDVLAAGEEFTGVNAKATNNGNTIPIESDLGHIQEGFAGDSVLLDSVLAPGRRSPSAIDLAILADIGYEIAGFDRQGSTPEIATEAGELIFGAIADEEIDGKGGDDEIQGNLGNDTLKGAAGADRLFGEEGNDILFGGEGNDEINGNEDADTIYGGAGDDRLFGELGDDSLLGETGADRLQGDGGNDTLRGNDGNDSIFGGEGDDLLFGNSGVDRLQGDVGNDILRGGEGNDFLFGEEGDDTIEGGGGDDSLLGDTGSDRFEFGKNFGSDRINDFSTEEDTIAISANYDFATDTYDFNDSAEIIANISRTGSVADSTDSFTEFTPRENETITVIHDAPLTTENIEIYFPFQSQVTVNPSGFTLEFSQELNLDRLNLYQGTNLNTNVRVPDLKLVSQTTEETIEGSVVVDNSDRSLTFINTDSILPPDDYSLTLFSRRDGFTSEEGELLDGDLDGIAGNNFITEFTVEPIEQRILSIDDFSRGIGQAIENPLNNDDIPIALNDGTGVTQVDFTLTYDESNLVLEDILINPELGRDWTLNDKDLSNSGIAKVTITGTTPLNPGEIDLVRLQATVPETANSNTSSLLKLETVSLNNGGITAIGDSAIQQITYLGDTNSDRNYSNLDAYNISLVSTGISDGFDDLNLTNPRIIGDINGDGVISAFDSYLVAKQARGETVNFIPDIPEEPFLIL